MAHSSQPLGTAAKLAGTQVDTRTIPYDFLSQPMNCRTFRKRHVAFVDDIVSGVELAEMRQHLDECPSCARQDARIRRSLLLVRNLPLLEPSSHFRERLRARLLAAAFMPAPVSMVSGRFVRLAAAASVLLVAGYFIRGFTAGDSGPLSLAPVVASIPEPPPSPVTSPVLTLPAVIASFSAGLAMWPAALVADQAPMYFVEAAFASDELSR